MRRRSLKGAIASRRAKGLPPEALGELETPRDAERWLRVVGEAVASGRLGHREGHVVSGAVREWLKAHAAGVVADELEELRAQVDSLKGRRGPRAML